MANASVKITIKPFTDSVPTLTPASGSGSGFKYATFGPIKSLQTTALKETTSGQKRLTLTQPTNVLTPNYVPGRIDIGGSGNLKLNIKVVDDAASPVTYVLSGLLFTPRDATTLDAFPDFTCLQDGSIDLTDMFKRTAPFNFLLVVQNYFGGVAAIDPQISNQ